MSDEIKNKCEESFTTTKSTTIQDKSDQLNTSSFKSDQVNNFGSKSDRSKPSELMEKDIDDDDKGSRENRLTSIIEQLRCASQLKGYNQRAEIINNNVTNGEGGGGRRCARESGGSPAHAPTAPTMPPAQQTLPQPPVKPERLSPHDNASSASRSRSVTPSTSSYPGTPPERGSPHAPAAPPHPAPAQPPRNYSDIMRSLAARYNTPHANEYFHRLNGFSGVDTKTVPQTSPIRAEVADSTLGGLFTGFGKHQGGPTRLPAFPAMIDMSTTKTLLALSRVSRMGRHRRKRSGTIANTEHSPLDLSAASESAAKRARLSASPSVKSDCDERERDVRSELQTECLCAEARARLNAWSVDDVCNFVNSIDICAEYASNFREQRIDGAGLPLLTEDHLTGMLQMKLGPALKLRAVLSKRLEPCAYCLSSTNHNSSLLVTPKLETKINGSAMKPEPRSNTTSPS